MADGFAANVSGPTRTRKRRTLFETPPDLRVQDGQQERPAGSQAPEGPDDGQDGGHDREDWGGPDPSRGRFGNGTPIGLTQKHGSRAHAFWRSGQR
jgi:hypothetical protein